MAGAGTTGVSSAGAGSTAATGAGAGTAVAGSGVTGVPSADRRRTISASEPSSTPAAAPTATSSAPVGLVGLSGAAAGASGTRRTPVSLLVPLAKAISARATASAVRTASLGRVPVPSISITGASGEVVALTRLVSSAGVCPASPAASASTCG